MSDITIRAARLADAASLKHLLDRSWRAHWAPHLDGPALARYQEEQPVAGYVDAYLGAFAVAERAGVVVGMYHLDGPWLLAIHVDSWAIGTGVGRALMDAAEAGGARQLEVRAFNRRAHAFYLARGWLDADEHQGSEMGMLVRTIVMARG
eukprot:GHVR01190030.1.p4 GENE.GHVR01190030.1~~GHVR01190030.1.p4  ORF type:complete len:150 (-),score=44.36 GHVR01190030.1:169-618(-)